MTTFFPKKPKYCCLYFTACTWPTPRVNRDLTAMIWVDLVLCYDKHRNWFIWHSSSESTHTSGPKNVNLSNTRKICLNYAFWTMWTPTKVSPDFKKIFASEFIYIKLQILYRNQTFSCHFVLLKCPKQLRMTIASWRTTIHNLDFYWIAIQKMRKIYILKCMSKKAVYEKFPPSHEKWITMHWAHWI